MKRIDIDFAPRTLPRAVLQTSFASWLLLLVAISLWVIIAFTAINLVKQKNATAKILGQVVYQAQSQLNERAARTQLASQFVVPEAQALAVNKAIEQLNLPWRDLFDAMESATPANIALIAIEPDAKKHVLKATAEAKTSDDMIGYIEQLKRQEFFGSVLLTKHEINEQDPNKPVRFQLEARWMASRP